MTSTDLMRHAAGVFDALGVHYAVVGSMASSFYGDPRTTNDVDIIADLSLNHVDPLVTAFRTDDFYISEDAVREAVQSKSQFNIILPEYGLKVDVVVKSIKSADQTDRRKSVPFKSETVPTFFAAPEDVILGKLAFYREGGSDKHLRDISGMLRISRDLIDFNYLNRWAAELGLKDIWDGILEKNRDA